MNSQQDDMAYVDKAFPTGHGQTISRPCTVAYQTELLQVQPHDKVLEIGTGSGYQAAVLAEIGADVFTIEWQKKLFDRNQHLGFCDVIPISNSFMTMVTRACPVRHFLTRLS